MEKESGKLEEEYYLLLALAYTNLEKKKKPKCPARAGKDPEEILASPEKEEAQEILDLMERGRLPFGSFSPQSSQGRGKPLISKSMIDFWRESVVISWEISLRLLTSFSRALASPEEALRKRLSLPL